MNTELAEFTSFPNGPQFPDSCHKINPIKSTPMFKKNFEHQLLCSNSNFVPSESHEMSSARGDGHEENFLRTPS